MASIFQHISTPVKGNNSDSDISAPPDYKEVIKEKNNLKGEITVTHIDVDNGNDVKWRPVMGGLVLQFYFAVMILKWVTGYEVFRFIGERVQAFLTFTDYGSQFVFGEKFTEHIFAMKVLPVVVFFSCTINILYHIGAMQLIISKIGWVFRKVLRTTAPESLCAAANIFIGMPEAPIMIRPFLGLMTLSELNAVMTRGFATIAGGVMAAYISFGVPAEHLLYAPVMNAPCGLAVYKLLYPETLTSRIGKLTDVDLREKNERNIVEAAATGASACIKLVANIVTNLIAFLALLAFVNAMLSWLGSFVCHPEFPFKLICSYVFMPVAYLMGVDWTDAGTVGEFIRIKTFLNEFVAYKELSVLMSNRVSCTGSFLSARSELITTYALCGFYNLSSIGVHLGGLCPMAPSRSGDLAEVVLRSLFGGIIVSLMTASLADGVECAVDTEGTTDEDDTQSGERSNFFSIFHRIHQSVGSFINDNKTRIRFAVCSAIIGCYSGYFIWAMVLSVLYKCKDPLSLIVLTVFTVICVILWFVKTRFHDNIQNLSEKLKSCVKGHISRILHVILLLVVFGGIVTIVAVTVWRRPMNLIALGGLLLFLGLLWIFSAHPSQVKWRPVIGGLVLQFYFAVTIMKWNTGYEVFRFIGERVQAFLTFTDYGSQFVFGEKFTDHIFAMKVLPVVVFFSCAINILYYIGVMHIIISKTGWVFRKILRTTAPESLCAAANIFIGMTEAPIMIHPFLGLMTLSELNAVMTGGFATIAGSVMAAYISFGVPAEHLLCASVMNAPCALAVSKLLYPETETSRIRKLTDVDLSEKNERNILEAAAAGASASIKLVANIAVNLIAFLALLAFVNAMLSWLGSFVCHPELSFQLICSYMFMPVACLMGVDWTDAGVVGEFIGIKTFLNEFVAYKELSVLVSNRVSCTGSFLSARSELITTYALCGFSNLSAIGVQLGGLCPMAPSRRGDLAEVVSRSLFGGIIVSLMTASIAGLLLVDLPEDTCRKGLAVNASIGLNTTGASLDTDYIVNYTLSSIVL